MKPFKGRIKNWRLELRGLHHVVTGEIECEFIRTSLVWVFAPIAGYVETQNSLYGLEGPPRESA